MLIWMRDGAGAGVIKMILMSLLVMAVAGLVLMDVGGFFRGDMSSGTVVKGGGVKIGTSEFDRTVRRVLATQGIGPEEALRLGLIDNIITSEIQTRLLTHEANDIGIVINDDAVMKQIAMLSAPLAADGRSKSDAVRQLLRSQNISEGEFVASVRQEMANGILRTALQTPATLTSPLMAQALYRYDNERRGADIIVLKNTAVSDVKKPTEEQLKTYYEANKQDFLIPQSRRITVATLKPDMIRKNVTIGDDKLKAEYDRNIATFTKPPRRLVEQSIFPDEAAAKAALEDVKSGQAMKDSNTQEFEQTGLLPEIATPVFAAKKGDILGPVQTALGWHVLKVRDILPEDVTPFAEVKEKLRTELANIALSEEMYNTGNTIEDRVAGGEKLEDLVGEYGMTTEMIGPFRENGNDSDGRDLFKSYETDRTKMIQAAFDYEEGEIAPVVETADGNFNIIRIDQVVPDAYRSFASEKSALEKRWISEQQRLANREKAKSMLDALNGGKSLEDVAREFGGSIQKISGINRRENPPAPITPVIGARIFAVEKGAGFSAETEDGFVVGAVRDIMIPAPAAKDDKELKDLADMAARAAGQETLGLYATHLTGKKKIQINRPLLERMYGGQQAQQ